MDPADPRPDPAALAAAIRDCHTRHELDVLLGLAVLLARKGIVPQRDLDPCCEAAWLAIDRLPRPNPKGTP